MLTGSDKHGAGQVVGRLHVLHLMCKGSSRMYQLRCVLPSAITAPFPAPQSKGTGTSPRGPRAQPVTRTRETLPGRGCLSLEQAGRLKGRRPTDTPRWNEPTASPHGSSISSILFCPSATCQARRRRHCPQDHSKGGVTSESPMSTVTRAERWG